MYKKLIETKIVRTKHQVTFHVNSTAYSIMKDFQSVPQWAKFIQYDEDDDERTLTFEEDKNG